ncbi:MAG: DUF4954 family protein, partial [Planctomycetes bacterium]|nr:DUF4954 family protein [Planctomycetota bacterium]
MDKNHSFRALTAGEIAILEAGGSRADDWTNVQVAQEFKAETVVRSGFSGSVKLGAFQQPVKVNGAPLPSGIYDSQLHNSSINDNSLVQQTALLANYEVGANVSILNCGLISVEGESAFGNGCELEVLNEGGGRELKIFERLSSQLAYLWTCYRHRPKLVEAINNMIEAYAASKKSTRGIIGDGALLTNCQSIKNVQVGPAATLDRVLGLENGTILSKPEAVTKVGAGVEATNFIISTGASVTGAAILSKCFVGQGCKIGHQFSAEGSTFFANCEGFHGEAVCLLAGPYTVTHHKSTLLIAGLF